MGTEPSHNRRKARHLPALPAVLVARQLSHLAYPKMQLEARGQVCGCSRKGSRLPASSNPAVLCAIPAPVRTQQSREQDFHSWDGKLSTCYHPRVMQAEVSELGVKATTLG